VKIFYSWQSDTPSNIGKNFIRKALDEAVELVGASLDLDDAERPSIDQDTQGVLGDPSITDTIFRKIREANVVVSDVTLTGDTESGKRLANSNVAIELGYTYGTRGDLVALKVMNTHYGEAEALPFNLRHKRYPVEFHVSPSTTKSERRSERTKLAKEFADIIQKYVDANRPLPELFIQRDSACNQAAYWETGEKLIDADRVRGHGNVSLGYLPDQPLMYLRIWPELVIPELTVSQLQVSQRTLEPLGGGLDGWSWHRNQYETIGYSHDGEGCLASSVQVFKTGEIWGVNAFLLGTPADDRKYIPMIPYEKAIYSALNKYLQTARECLGYPAQTNIESGIVNIRGYGIDRPPGYTNHLTGNFFHDLGIETSVDTESSESITKALLKIFQKTFDAAGEERPANFHGFPGTE